MDLATLLVLGSSAQRKGKLDVAENVWRRCIADHPGDFRAFFNLSSLLSERRDGVGTLEAVGLLEEAHRLAPHIVETCANLAGLKIKLGCPGEAIAWCERGLSLPGAGEPPNSECLFNLNVALRQEGRMQEAIQRTLAVLNDVILASSSPALAVCPLQAYPPTVFPSPQDEEVVFVCVKWGSKYGPEYVNALLRALQNHHTSPSRSSSSSPTPPVRLVCLTDDPAGIDPNVDCLLLPQEPSEWRHWWLKAHLFGPDLAAHIPAQVVVVYLDLDTVICNSLEKCLRPLIDSARGGVLLSLSAGHFPLSEGRAQGINSSLLVWCNGRGPDKIYSFLKSHYRAVTRCIYKFDHFLEMMLLFSDEGHEGFQFVPQTPQIVDFAHLAALDKGSRDDLVKPGGVVSIVCFPLHPKPHHEVDNHEWIRRNWKF